MAQLEDRAQLVVANKTLLTVAIMSAMVMQVLDTTITNVALPHMRAALGASDETISWVLTSYILATAVAIPITGWLADRIGARRLLLPAQHRERNGGRRHRLRAGSGGRLAAGMSDLRPHMRAVRLARLLPAEALVAGHSRVTLGTEDAARFLSGLRRRGAWADAAEVAVFGEEPAAFLGTAHVTANELIPGRLLNPIEIQQILLNAPANATLCETTP